MEFFPIMNDHWIRHKEPQMGLQTSLSYPVRCKNAVPSEKERTRRIWEREDVGAWKEKSVCKKKCLTKSTNLFFILNKLFCSLSFVDSSVIHLAKFYKRSQSISSNLLTKLTDSILTVWGNSVSTWFWHRITCSEHKTLSRKVLCTHRLLC